MQQVIEDWVQTDPHRQEVKNMRKSYAEVLKDEGRNEGRLSSRRESLVRLIRVRFGAPPAEIVAAIDACTDIAQLDAWLDAVGTARRLNEVRFQPGG